MTPRKVHLWIGCFALIIALFMFESAAVAQQYSIVNLGSLGGPNSFAAAINSSGQVTGWSDTTPHSTFYVDAFLYSNGAMKDLGTMGTSYSVGTAINDNGQVTGYYTGGSYAFLYTDGIMRDLLGGQTEAGTVDAYGLNDSGQVTGYVAAGNGAYAFLVNGESLQNIGQVGGYATSYANAINQSGVIVGGASNGAFIYHSGVFQNIGGLNGTANSQALAINNSGQVVGQSFYATSGPKIHFLHGFLYSNGVMRDIGTLGGPNSFAYGINDQGQIVGSADNGAREYQSYIRHAFLYQNGTMVDLNSLIPSAAAQLYTLTEARGINNNGQIVANGFLKAKPTGFQLAFLLTPIQ